MDNRIFNVNGEGLPFLTKTIDLAYQRFADLKEPGIKAWLFEPQKGLILFAYPPSSGAVNNFMAPVTPEIAAKMVFDWLKTDQCKSIKPVGEDADLNHDGHNGPGWRVYVEAWGHVGSYNSGVVCAITPAFMWYGK